jgi:mannitol operon transcriptional antiterminator
MVTLTTRQRDLLQLLLQSETPLVAADIACQLQLTARQVNYGLKGMGHWLQQYGVDLKVTPGVGVELESSATQRRTLAKELNASSDFQLVLTAAERQQLIALTLLTNDKPTILYQLQQSAQVSRTTVLKDLTAVEEWFTEFQLTLQRRPNHGIWLVGNEQDVRQAIVALLWGTHPFEEPLMSMTHLHGLRFPLAADAQLLPLVAEANQLLPRWDAQRALSQVAYAETQLGGRFTDDTVLLLSLRLAVQMQRVQQKKLLASDTAMIRWLQELQVWPVAETICRRLFGGKTAVCPQPEIASIAAHLLAGERNGRWPGDLEIDSSFNNLIDSLMSHTATAYKLPHLSQDTALRDGLVSHIVPACLRQRFNIWTPAPHQPARLSERYSLEKKIAHELTQLIAQQTQAVLLENDVNNIALLLRAAYIREQPSQNRRVIVVCPSGMATAQLLVARLKARFARLGTLEVLSLREIKPHHLEAAQLLITTVPLPPHLTSHIPCIQVHPLLLPEDVEAITQWLT